jgi:hypothetical protein
MPDPTGLVSSGERPALCPDGTVVIREGFDEPGQEDAEVYRMITFRLQDSPRPFLVAVFMYEAPDRPPVLHFDFDRDGWEDAMALHSGDAGAAICGAAARVRR